MSRRLPSLAAPWRSKFLTQIKEMELPTCSLSTVHHYRGSSPTNITPRCRTLVLRGLWAELQPHPNSVAQLNPCTFESDLLTFTTDVRMEKVPEMILDGPTSHESGGGAPVEAVFWLAPSKTQWRFRGLAYLLGPDIDGSSASAVRQAIEMHMRPKNGEDHRPWSWSRELTAHFGNLSPSMRGSFRNPPPGTPRSAHAPPGFAFGEKLNDLEDHVARKNFRVVVVVPEEVDYLDLSNPDDPRRWKYEFIPDSWKEEELWP